MTDVVLVRSIQRRVALVSAMVVTIALAIGVVGMEVVEGFEHEQLLDGRLKHLARTILKFVDDQPEQVGEVTPEARLRQGVKAEKPI
jgi:hypothetical protein